MDKLFIEGLEIWTRVGCSAEEKGFPQKVELDVALGLSLSAAGKRDDLSRSADYAAVVNRLKVLETLTFNLIEALAEKAAGIVLEEKNVKSVVIRARKRALPGIFSAGVEIRRGQDS